MPVSLPHISEHWIQGRSVGHHRDRAQCHFNLPAGLQRPPANRRRSRPITGQGRATRPALADVILALSPHVKSAFRWQRELVQSGLLRNPRLQLRIDFLKSENSALLGCLDTFVDRSHKLIGFLGFLKPSQQ